MPKPKKPLKPKIRKAAAPRRSDVFQALRPGDLIEIIAPGSHAPLENLEKGAAVLRSWGYRVSYEPDLLEPTQVFLANTDEKRLESFRRAMLNPESRAVWCLRGGYGAIRLLPEIEKMRPPRQKKLLVGLSDVSSLHAVLNQKWKWPTLHGPLLDRLALNQLTPENMTELRAALENPALEAAFSALRPLNRAGRARKKIRSSVVGGNLMVLASTLGTPSQIRTRGRILFLEEISERAYRVDRCLQQMRQAGLFRDVAAVVLGDFTNCGEPNGENHIWPTLEAFFRDMKFPVFAGVECGHGTIQRPLFFGTEAHIACGEAPRMLVYSPFRK